MGNTNNQYDVVIVGGGFAGSALAYRLAKANKKVLVIEAGIPTEGVITEQDQNALATTGTRAQFMEDFFLAMAKTPESPYVQNFNAPRPTVLDIKQVTPPYLTPNSAPPPPVNCSDVIDSINQNGYLIQKGPIPFGSTYERRGGGTSWHWLGTCLRLMPNDFKMFTTYGVGVDWPMTYDDLSAYYDQAEYEIGVSANVDEQGIHGITFTPGYQYPMSKIPPTLLDVALTTGLSGQTFDGCSLDVTGTPAGRNGAPNPNGVPASVQNAPAIEYDQSYISSGYYNNGRRQCQGNTNCTPICPIQAKYDATITLKKAAMTGNVTIIYQAVACEIQIDPTTKEVTGIGYKKYVDIKNTTPQEKSTVYYATGTKYIIAAHAIEAAKLLLMSNAANSSGLVGKNLMDHPMYLGWGSMPNPTYPFRGPLATSGIEGTRDGAFRTQRSAFRVEIGNEGWNWTSGAPYNQVIDLVSPTQSGVNPVFGTALRQNIQSEFTRQFRLGYLIEQLPSTDCYVELSDSCFDLLGMPRPVINYAFDEYTMKGFEAAAAATEQIFKTVNATDETTIPVGTGGAFEYNGTIYYAQGAGHVMGTHCMGTDASNSVTDNNMKSWDHDNLYLVGCGSFPTTATANPTLTMMALTFKAADAVLASF
jgi:choline dehydrogenase-like flavoprotein